MTPSYYSRTLYTELGEVILSRLVHGATPSDVRTNELVSKLKDCGEDPGELEGCWASPFTVRLVEDFEQYFIDGASLGYEYWCLGGNGLFSVLAQRATSVSYDFGEQIQYIARAAGIRWAISVGVMERDLFLMMAQERLSRL